MSTPPAWLTPHAGAAAQHPAAHRQRRQYGPSAHWALPRAAGVDGDPHFESMYSQQAPEQPGQADVHRLHDAEDRFPLGVDGLAFGAPGLAEAMVHQEASARESAEQMLEEERERARVEQEKQRKEEEDRLARIEQEEKLRQQKVLEEEEQRK